MSGDKGAIRSAVETIIAEEKDKQHKILADRLTRAMHTNGNGGTPVPVQRGHPADRGREFVAEITPRQQVLCISFIHFPMDARLIDGVFSADGKPRFWGSGL